MDEKLTVKVSYEVEVELNRKDFNSIDEMEDYVIKEFWDSYQGKADLIDCGVYDEAGNKISDEDEEDL